MNTTYQENLEDDLLEDTLENKYIIFGINDKQYGFEIRYLIEIIAMQPITGMDDMPSFIKGVINLRGKIIPVFDVRIRFGIQPLEYSERTCILIVTIDNTLAGLIVDTVYEVIKIPKENIEAVVTFGHIEHGKDFIQSVGKVEHDIKILIDLEKFFYSKQFLGQLQEKV